MNRLSFISIVLLAISFSQEIDTSLVSNEEVLNASEEARDMDLPKESILFDDVYYENGINK